MNEAKRIMLKAEAYAKHNAVSLCQELLALQDGATAGVHMDVLIVIIGEIAGLDVGLKRRIAESLIQRAALERVVAKG